jgi:hypothetical protein
MPKWFQDCGMKRKYLCCGIGPLVNKILEGLFYILAQAFKAQYVCVEL